MEIELEQRGCRNREDVAIRLSGNDRGKCMVQGHGLRASVSRRRWRLVEAGGVEF